MYDPFLRPSGLIAPKVIVADDPKDNTGEISLIECGCCECWHPEDFKGDCRDNDNRLHPDDLQEAMPNVIVYEVENGIRYRIDGKNERGECDG